MREIKFRAWDKQEEKMSQSFDLFSIYSGRDEAYILSVGEEDFRWHKDLIIMQYTGLKDKNGKEIYEGDILGYSDSSGILGAVKYSHKVELYADSGCGTCGPIKEWKPFAGFVTEGVFTEPMTGDGYVIGNIYENPELLEK